MNSKLSMTPLYIEKIQELKENLVTLKTLF